MATLQERLQIRRVPIDKWSTREQLCLASAVVRSGDQNWMSVSRALKPFAEPNRPPDWFSQKNCAAQYGSLLEHVETPKRKKRASGAETLVETPGESILKKLIQERTMELQKLMEEEKIEYLKLKNDMEIIRSGANDAIVERMCAGIDEEDKQKEKDAVAHAQWLKLREERKLEVERVFRPIPKIITPRKVDSLELVGVESDESQQIPETKPALSPLLTSLLKTPAHVPTTTSTLLHTAITSQPSPTPPAVTVPSPELPPEIKPEPEPEPEVVEPSTSVIEPKDVQENEIITTEQPIKEEVEASPDVAEEETVVPEAVPETNNTKPDVYDFETSSPSEQVKEVETNIPDVVPETIEVKVEPSSPEEQPKEPEPEPAVIEAPEEEDSDKEMNKKVSELKQDLIRDKVEKSAEEVEEKVVKLEKTVYDEYDFDDAKKPPEKVEEAPEFPRKSSFTPEPFFDDATMEVTKLDKTGKAKRDYSRTKKIDDKDLDLLLAVAKAELLDDEVLDETESEKEIPDKLKEGNDRSNSPWTEEEEPPKTRRRMSTTPATPSDSIPNSPASGTAFDDDREYRTWKKSVMLVYSRLAAHKCASLFLKPITDDQAPGYHTIVYRPMDLQTIRRNIENGHVRTTTEFQRDVLLMFNNAIFYNKTNKTVYSMARQMQMEGLQQIQILLQAQTETPARRETRTSESGLKRKRGQEELLLKNKKRRDD